MQAYMKPENTATNPPMPKEIRLRVNPGAGRLLKIHRRSYDMIDRITFTALPARLLICLPPWHVSASHRPCRNWGGVVTYQDLPVLLVTFAPVNAKKTTRPIAIMLGASTATLEIHIAPTRRPASLLADQTTHRPVDRPSVSIRPRHGAIVPAGISRQAAPCASQTISGYGVAIYGSQTQHGRPRQSPGNFGLSQPAQSLRPLERLRP